MDYNCVICKEAISQGVYQYSTKQFGKPLCMQHQKTAERHFCSDCNKEITYGQLEFSLREFNLALCRDCQPEFEEKLSVPPQKYQLNKTSKIEFGRSLSEKQ